MNHRIELVPYSISSRLQEVDLKLPEGNWIIWWYGRLKRNMRDASVPLVQVLFRKLEDGCVTDCTVREIALPRLVLYRIGTVFSDGIPVARRTGEDAWLDVSFDRSARQFALPRNLAFSSSEYELLATNGDDWLLEFSLLNGGKLYVNCIEYLIRGYSTNAEVARVLTTYPWDEVRRRFFASNSWEDGRWVVYPHSQMVKADEIFLAHAHNDFTARDACRWLYAQLDHNSFRDGDPYPLQVHPWFKGPTKLKCRGIPLSNGQDFLCTELLGFCLPAGTPFEVIDLYAEKGDASHDEVTAPVPKSRGADHDLSAIPMTDSSQPDVGSRATNIEHEVLEVIFPEREVTHTRQAKPYSEKTRFPGGEKDPKQFSTGEGHGLGDEDTGTLRLRSRLADAHDDADGVLAGMWGALEQLKNGGHIDTLQWYTQNGAGDELPFSLTELPGKETHWLGMDSGRKRGLLALLISVGKRQFMLFEIERKVVEKPLQNGLTVLDEENFSGLICEVVNAIELSELLTIIASQIVRDSGNFKAEKNYPLPYKVFRHKDSSSNTVPYESTAIHALNSMRLNIPKLRKRDREVDVVS
ncbi:hypothetical protein [Pseudomonas aeruginosa]|uniref:hypothetical protein n=1 Tax=Pseudomonas aeruginosa TaxID=287 RepID=UPI001BDB3780|nr:hypothetical protein [Pseudomonas aeruginosa]